MARVVVEGDAKLRRQLEKIVDGLDDLRPVGTTAAALVAERAASQAPIDSGALRDDIRTFATKRNAGVRVGRARVPYAGPIVGGHGAPGVYRLQGGYVDPPQPFIYDALDDRTDAIEAAHDEFINDLLAGKRPKAQRKYRIHSDE